MQTKPALERNKTLNGQIVWNQSTVNLHENQSFGDENLNRCQVVEHVVHRDKEQKTVSTIKARSTKLRTTMSLAMANYCY